MHNEQSSAGTEIKLSSFGKNGAQRWKLVDNGDGSYSFAPECAGGMQLTVMSVADYGNIVLQPAGTSAYQKFTLEKYYGNLYFLKLWSNPAFSIDGNNSDCYLYSTNGTRCQQFALIPADPDETISSSAGYSANGEYMTSLTDSRGNTTTYGYNEDLGRLESETNAKGVETEYTYNDSDQLACVQTGTSSVQYAYTTAKELSSINSPGGTVYAFTYDDFGRTETISVGSTLLNRYNYDEQGRLTSSTYGNNTSFTYTYDSLNRETGCTVDGVLYYTKYYDGASRLIEYRDERNGRAYQYEYDILDRPVSEKIIHRATGIALARITLRYDDSKNRLAGCDVTVEGHVTSYDYIYGGNGESPDTVTGLKVNGTLILSYDYDTLNRLAKRTLATSTPFETSYSYLEGADASKTTTLVQTVKNGDDTLSYTYDAVGNITSVSENGVLVESYTYDALNQLKTVTRGSDVWEYSYDDGGNLLFVKKNGVEEKFYSYGNSDWKDLLTGFNGETITYDAIGNPLQYRDGFTFTWVNGRKLGTVTKNGSTTTYTYNADGLRLSKSVNGITTTYHWLEGTLLGQTTGSVC